MEKPSRIEFDVIDDSGWLALIDTHSYKSFLGADWDFSSLLAHINSQADLNNILFWKCGSGGQQIKVEIDFTFSQREGFKLITGYLHVSNDNLHLVSYNALTMAAQFSDERLPSRHEEHLKIPLKIGFYFIRVIQNFDPDDYEFDGSSIPHFSIEVGKKQ